MERIEYYTDYRAYLKDYYEDQKKRNSYFSYRYFCKKGGITSPSLLRSVINGTRNLTEHTIAAFAKGLGLNELDAKFFHFLVLFNQSKSDKQKQQYLEDLRGLKRKVRQKLIPLDRYAYYAVWHNIAIRELACMLDWKGDYGVLAKALHPAITKSQARKSVETLLGLGFLEKKDDGTYRQTDPAITTGSEVISVAVRELNRQMSELGTTSIQRFPASERDVSSLTIGIRKSSYALIKQEIQEFKNRIIRIADDDKESDIIYNLNVQLFPLSTQCKRTEEPHEGN